MSNIARIIQLYNICQHIVVRIATFSDNTNSTILRFSISLNIRTPKF